MKNILYPNINAERARRGLSIEETAKLLNVTRKTFYNWVTSGNIPQNKLEKMSDIFGCSVDYLLVKNVTETA